MTSIQTSTLQRVAIEPTKIVAANCERQKAIPHLALPSATEYCDAGDSSLRGDQPLATIVPLTPLLTASSECSAPHARTSAS
jgi:hypothetical protein